MRTKLRFIVVGVLVLVLAIGAGMIARSLWRQKKGDLALEAIELLPDVAQRIQDFHRTRIVGDRKVWEVSAKEARYFEKDGVVAVQDPVVAVFLEEGRTVAMRGRSGKVYLVEKSVERVEVEGEVEVELDEYLVSTDFARYEAELDTIVVPGTVRMESTQIQFEGEAMEVDLGANRLRVGKNVHMLLWPKD